MKTNEDMADYVSCKVCKELILSILNRTNTVLTPWNTGLDDTYLTYPEDRLGRKDALFITIRGHLVNVSCRKVNGLKS